MPKPLREPPPSSSVARLLDVEAATRALAPTQPPRRESTLPKAAQSMQPPVQETADAMRPQTIPEITAPPSNIVSPPFPLMQPTGEPANIKREFVLSPSTDEAFTRLVELYRRATGTRLSSSHVARALLKGVAACMTSLEREAESIGRLRLPGNARGREGERERFEDRIAEAFVNGVRSAAAYRGKGR